MNRGEVTLAVSASTPAFGRWGFRPSPRLSDDVSGNYTFDDVPPGNYEIV